MNLKRLNQLSQSKSFQIPSPEEMQVSRHELWAPHSLTPWTYLESYEGLSENLKIRYNQLQALAINELFVWFEKNLLLGVFRNILTHQKFDKDFFEACEIFCTEEEKHSIMFMQLNKISAPEFYDLKDFYFLEEASRFKKVLLEKVLKMPQVFSIWCWILIFFEERTLMFSKEYMKNKSHISQAFVHVHQLHFVEEVRHVQLDEYFIDTFYKNISFVQRFVTAKILNKVFHHFASPYKMSKAIIKTLKKEFPEEQNLFMLEKIENELPLLRTNKKFQLQFFGPEATQKTFKLINCYPEFKKILHYFNHNKI
jgi:hypothetical protein